MPQIGIKQQEGIERYGSEMKTALQLCDIFDHTGNCVTHRVTPEAVSWQETALLPERGRVNGMLFQETVECFALNAGLGSRRCHFPFEGCHKR